jgi:hypothetical protein
VKQALKQALKQATGSAALAGPKVLVLEYFPTASFGRASWDTSISFETRLDGHKITAVDDALMTVSETIDHRLTAVITTV